MFDIVHLHSGLQSFHELFPCRWFVLFYQKKEKKNTVMMRSRAVQLTKSEQASNQGYDLCRQGKYADALVYYKKAALMDPTNHKYWYNAAVACDRMGDHSGMESLCIKTIECNGTFVKGYVRLAKALLRQDKVDNAARAVTTGLLVAPDNSELTAIQKEIRKKQEELSVVAIQRLRKEEQRRNKPVRREVAIQKAAQTRPTPADPPRVEPPRQPSNRSNHHRSDRPKPAHPNRAGPNHLVRYKDQVHTLVLSEGAVQHVSDGDATVGRATQEQPKRQARAVVKKSSPPQQEKYKSSQNTSSTRRLLRGGHSSRNGREFEL